MDDYLLIGIDTGLAWLQTFTVEGDTNSDLPLIVSDYVMEHKEDFACCTYDHALMMCGEDDEIVDESYFAVNGGEYYVGAIRLCQPIKMRELADGSTVPVIELNAKGKKDDWQL